MYIDVDETHKSLIHIETDEVLITSDEISKLDMLVKKLHKKYDSINVIVLVSKESRRSFKVIYETLKYAISDHKIIRKIAIVGYTKRFKFRVKRDDVAFNQQFPWREKYFNIDHLEEAWDWITYK